MGKPAGPGMPEEEQTWKLSLHPALFYPRLQGKTTGKLSLRQGHQAWHLPDPQPGWDHSLEDQNWMHTPGQAAALWKNKWDMKCLSDCQV